MSFLSLTIEFEDQSSFNMRFEQGNISSAGLPEWAKLKYLPCPGNSLHGPDIEYCRLAVEVGRLVDYFANIESIEKGKLTLQHQEDLEIVNKNDAQTIFYKAFWFILLHSKCSVFQFSQWARSNYIPSTSPERMLYMFFSIFLTEHYMLDSNENIDIEKFKVEMQLLREVLHNLLERIKQGINLSSDAIANGLVMFSNLVVLFDIEFDRFYLDLKQQLNHDSLLRKWQYTDGQDCSTDLSITVAAICDCRSFLPIFNKENP